MRRPDGKPEVGNHAFVVRAESGDTLAATCEVSAAHARDVTLAVAGPGKVACDIEPSTAHRADVWRDLLGAERWTLAQFLAHETGQSETEAATRTWVASECLTKAGVVSTTPLVLGETPPDSRTVVLHSDQFAIVTLVLADRMRPEPFVLGVLTRRKDA